MKKIGLAIGIIMVLISSIAFIRHTMNFDQLSEYGLGYVFGKFIILLIGIVLVYFNLRKKKTKHR